MLISHRKRFIYTKTSKTAGTSVESYFEPYCMAEGSWEFRRARKEHVSAEGIIGYRGGKAEGNKWRNHMPASEIRNRIGDSIWNAYFKFCVIRNPFDKLVSAFYFLEKQRKDHPNTVNWKNRLRRLYKKSDPFDNITGNNPLERFKAWIRRGGSVLDRDKYMIDGQVCVDYFIKFEDLYEGIQYVCSRLDISFEPEKIPKLKTGIRTHEIPLYQYYDSETIEIVRNIYKFELETFGYSEPRQSSTSGDRCEPMRSRV